MAQAALTAEIIARYQPGGDIYATIARTYRNGLADAEYVARAAATGNRDTLAEAIAYVRNGAALETSTGVIFLDQVLTDPLAAPIDALNKGVKQLFDSSGVKSLLTVAVVAVVVVLVVKTP